MTKITLLLGLLIPAAHATTVTFRVGDSLKDREVVTRLEGKDGGLSEAAIAVLASQGRAAAEAEKAAEEAAAAAAEAQKAEEAAEAVRAAEAERLRREQAQKEAERQREEDAARMRERLRFSMRAKSQLNPFAKTRDGGKTRPYPLYFIKSTASPSYCLTWSSKSSEVMLAVCEKNDEEQQKQQQQQLWYWDPASTYIHPKGNNRRCMDAASDRSGAALELSTCDVAARPFQKWSFSNSSSLVNTNSRRCLEKERGNHRNALELQKCLDKSEWHVLSQHWSWVPYREYPGYHLDGRTYAPR